MLNILSTLFKTFWAIVKYPLCVVGAGVFLFFVIFAVCCALEYKAGSRLKSGEHYRVKKPSVFYRLFWLAPRQYAKDYFARDPEWFKYQGCVVFSGRQGQGKTIAMVEQAMRLQQEYPKCKVISNCAYAKQDDELKHWKQLLNYKNGKQGVVVMMDEMQNWFSSNQSKNFPPEMLETVTQNRKNRRILMGTSQVFNRLSKPLREQTTEVRKCATLFGCITFVHRVRPELDSEGNVVKWKHIGFYFFVHTPEIRNNYDTYRVVESLAKSGFQERLPETKVVNYVNPAK